MHSVWKSFRNSHQFNEITTGLGMEKEGSYGALKLLLFEFILSIFGV